MIRLLLRGRLHQPSLLLLFYAFAVVLAPIQAVMMSGGRSMKLRVVSYNVLSSHLASPSHFTTLNPDHLQASNRLPIVLDKLDSELKKSTDSSSAPVIFCLQEVSYDWAGAFHTFFANRGYHVVTGLYGKKFNGYMGVALAWPTDTFETMNIDISRLADKRVQKWPPQDTKSVLEKVWDSVKSSLDSPLQYFGLKQQTWTIDDWEYAQWRQNVILTATLRHKESGQSFCIGNYHMPCAFNAPMVMTIHSEMAAKHVQNIAAATVSTTSTSIPYILAGDFNIKPADAMYALLTTGTLDPNNPAYPTPKNGHEWTVRSFLVGFLSKSISRHTHRK
jgi:2',5'-phosphodiesterase